MKTANYTLILGLLIFSLPTYAQLRNQPKFKFGKASFNKKGLLELKGSDLRNKYKVTLSNYWIEHFNEMRTILNIYMNTPNLKPSLTYKIDKVKKSLIISIYAPSPYDYKDAPSVKIWNSYFTRKLTQYFKYNRK